MSLLSESRSAGLSNLSRFVRNLGHYFETALFRAGQLLILPTTDFQRSRLVTGEARVCDEAV